MKKFKDIFIWTSLYILGLEAASSPSIDLLFNLRNSNESTTQSSSISQRISASLNNVLRLPLNISQNPPGLGLLRQHSPLRQPGGLLNLQPITGSQNAPPSVFLPNVNQAIQTIAQLSTLTHWPFGYVTTERPQAPPAPVASTPPPPPPTAPPVRVTQAPIMLSAPIRTSPRTPPPTTTARPPPQTTKAAPPPLPPSSSSIFQGPPPPAPPPPRPSLPDRIHNRIHNTLQYIRLPPLNTIGNPRPRPMLTEPPWVTELLGPTLEPPTTRAPTFGERIHNAVNNVLLFVPATLLNFWYRNWGTQHVDRVIQRLQIVTPRPGDNNPNLNLTAEQIAVLNATAAQAGYPAIAAFINQNGTLMPTIVQPVVNKTTNTIEYLLRGENETTVLWTGSLSNDIFFGNKKPEGEGEGLESGYKYGVIEAAKEEETEDDERDSNFIQPSLLNNNF